MTRGLDVQIDDHNMAWLSQWSWCSNEKEPGRHYAYRSIRSGKKHVHMHREIMRQVLGRNFTPKEEVDHKHGDTLDNRECNLRVATRTQQLQNAAKRPGCASRYKGVKFTHKSRPGGPPRAKPWYARVTVDKKTLGLGYYKTEKEAALAYNKAASHHFGEFARLNEVT